MADSKPTDWKQIVLGVVALVVLVALTGGILYGLSRVVSGALGGALAGGVVGLAVALASKAFEHQKQRDLAIAEKKREVYRRLLAPWEQLMLQIKAGKHGDDLLKELDLSAVYASAFDAVLYGSEKVVQRYVEFRSPDEGRDGIDTLRTLAALLVAMREDVTGKKTSLSVEAVLGTFMNFSDEERVLLRLRDYVATHPEAQRKLAEVLAARPDSPSKSAASKTG
jgi:hypothetical protein